MKLIEHWTTEDRYRPYKNWDPNYLNTLTNTVNKSKWRLDFHIQPISGLLNDPNGFSYFNGQWHLFYQAYPFGPVHGVKSWYHLISDNLIDWKNNGFALLPDSSLDSHGVYSGSAIAMDDKLLLSYTGNVRNKEWERASYQLGALLAKDGSVEKIQTPLIKQPPTGYTQEFRDPQIFSHNNSYYMVIGAQTDAEVGKILTYKSDDLLEWICLGELDYTDEDMGFMVECPNLLLTEDATLLLFCPQGLDKSILPYQNIYPNTYIIAEDFDAQENKLINPSQLHNLDEGFDVYATQAFKAPDDRLLAVSWVGLPEIDYPTDKDGWAHCLSLVKELTVKDKKMYQQPVKETIELREERLFSFDQECLPIYDTKRNSYELNLSFCESTKGSVTLLSDHTKNSGLTLNFDTNNGKMIIDRSYSGMSFASEYGNTREFSISKQPLHLQIFVDQSIVEIFINNGEQVATLRVFPETDQTCFHISSETSYEGTCWKLRKNNH